MFEELRLQGLLKILASSRALMQCSWQFERIFCLILATIRTNFSDTSPYILLKWETSLHHLLVLSGPSDSSSRESIKSSMTASRRFSSCSSCSGDRFSSVVVFAGFSLFAWWPFPSLDSGELMLLLPLISSCKSRNERKHSWSMRRRSLFLFIYFFQMENG